MFKYRKKISGLWASRDHQKSKKTSKILRKLRNPSYIGDKTNRCWRWCRTRCDTRSRRMSKVKENSNRKEYLENVISRLTERIPVETLTFQIARRTRGEKLEGSHLTKGEREAESRGIMSQKLCRKRLSIERTHPPLSAQFTPKPCVTEMPLTCSQPWRPRHAKKDRT